MGKAFWKCAGKSSLVCLWNLWEGLSVCWLVYWNSRWQVLFSNNQLMVYLKLSEGVWPPFTCEFEPLLWGLNIANLCCPLWVVVACVYVSQILYVGAAVRSVCCKVCPHFPYLHINPKLVWGRVLNNVVSGIVQFITMCAGECIPMQLRGPESSIFCI